MSIAAGARPVLATVQVARGLAALGDGRYSDAYAHLRRMHDPADPAYQVALRCYAVAELAEAAVRSGQTKSVRDIMEGLEALAATTTSPALHAGLRYARAVLAEDDTASELLERPGAAGAACRRRVPEALRGSLGFYRAFDATVKQNVQRKDRHLSMPVLAIGGEASYGGHVAEVMETIADDVRGVVIPGAGHWVAEEAPEQMLAALTTFLTPYRRQTGHGAHV